MATASPSRDASLARMTERVALLERERRGGTSTADAPGRARVAARVDAVNATETSECAGPRAEDGGAAYGGRVFGVAMEETRAFAVASVLCVVFVGASCYFEEYMYRQLPAFDYYWTVALAELLAFTLIASASAIANGTLRAKRKAPMELYAAQALLLAAYSAVGKLCYKWINYATGTVLRSSKLVFTMGISTIWLKRKYKLHQMVAAVLLVVAVAFFGIAEHEVGGQKEPEVAATDDGDASIGLGRDAKFALGFGLSVVAIFLGSLQSNVSEHAMRNHGASVQENILYSNAIGTVFALAAVVFIEGNASLRYMRTVPGAFPLLLARSVTFYLGAYTFSIIAKHFGATAATAVSTLRKALTVIVSFIAFPADKPLAGYFAIGLVVFLLSVFVESAHHFKACFDRVARAQRGEYARDDSV